MVLKKRTTINIDEALLDAVDDSGVKNFSAYVQKLIKADLTSLRSQSNESVGKLERLRERLDSLEKQWLAMEHKRAEAKE